MDSSSSISDSTELSDRTARPQQPPDVLEQSLRAMQGQLRSLAQGQGSTQAAIDALQRFEIPLSPPPPPPPEDHTSEPADRLHHIEEPIKPLLAQGHPRQSTYLLSRHQCQLELNPYLNLMTLWSAWLVLF